MVFCSDQTDESALGPSSSLAKALLCQPSTPFPEGTSRSQSDCKGLLCHVRCFHTYQCASDPHLPQPGAWPSLHDQELQLWARECTRSNRGPLSLHPILQGSRTSPSGSSLPHHAEGCVWSMSRSDHRFLSCPYRRASSGPPIGCPWLSDAPGS